MKIVVTERLHLAERAKQTLAELGSVSYGPFDDRALARELSDCDVLMVRLGRHIGETILSPRQSSNSSSPPPPASITSTLTQHAPPPCG